MSAANTEWFQRGLNINWALIHRTVPNDYRDRATMKNKYFAFSHANNIDRFIGAFKALFPF